MNSTGMHRSITRFALSWSILLIAGLLRVPALQAVDLDVRQLNSVRTVALDSMGLCWIGNPDGLFRFDGRFLIAQDSWAGYDGGPVQTAAVDGRGRLWIMAEKGLYRLEDQFRQVETQSPVLDARGLSIAFSGDKILLATDRGLVELDERGTERVLLTGFPVYRLLATSSGENFAGTAGRGLFAFDGDGNPLPTTEEFRTLLPIVLDLAEDDSSRVYVLGVDRQNKTRLAGLSRDRRDLDLLDRLNERLESVLSPLALGYTTQLAAVDGHVMIWINAAWYRITQTQELEGPLMSGDLGLTWPFQKPAYHLPQLTREGGTGRFHLLSTDSGVLVQQEGEVELIWQDLSGTERTRSRPIQVLGDGDRKLILLEQADGGRRLLSVSPEGYREVAVDRELCPDLAAVRTICWSPGGRGRGEFLLGLEDRILLQSGDRTRVLTERFGASWIEPFTDELVLLSGTGGAAFFDGERLRELRIREPVLLATHDGFRGILACCREYLLRLNALNELDTLAYPTTTIKGAPSAAAGGSPGDDVRQLLADGAGHFWLLAGEELFYRSSDLAGWTRPAAGIDLAANGILSMALDGTGRLWLSTGGGTGALIPDRLPPVAVLMQDPRRLDLGDPDLELVFEAADPMSTEQSSRVRVRLDDGDWTAWMKAPSRLPLGELVGGELSEGFHRLQAQALDSWGNLSARPLSIQLYLPEQTHRLPFLSRFFLLAGLMLVSVLASIRFPGRPSIVFSLLLGCLAGAWIFFSTDEPVLWLALPFILPLAAWSMSEHLRQRRLAAERSGSTGEDASYGGILELVDLFREFGHSGTATRNIDRLIRSSRNLYEGGRPDPDVSERFQEARRGFMDLTRHSLLAIEESIQRLPERDCPVTPEQLDQYHERVAALIDELIDAEELPDEEGLEELAFRLNQLQQHLGDLEHRVDLRISSSPLKVLDLVIDAHKREFGGLELALRCDRDLKQVLARLPVDKLQFILDNLVDNAIYWMKDSERPRLEVELVERPSALQIMVSDNGAGIPRDRWEQIFHPGVSGKHTEAAAETIEGRGSVDQPEDENPGGEGSAGKDGRHSGYGLYRSREILARFGGRIEVLQSKPGVGTTFLLEVKKVEPERPSGG